MRVQLIKFLVGIVFVLSCGPSLFAQDAEMVRHFDYDKSAPIDRKILASIPDLVQPSREPNPK